jgi:outer membrane protein TolC
MQKNIRLHGLIMGTTLFLTGNAQALTLHEAVSQALNTSPVMERAQSVTEEAKWRKVEGYSGFLPTVSANATYLFDKKYALTNVRLGGSPNDTIVPQIIPNSQLVLTTSYPLFEGFSSTNRLRAANENLNAANSELKWSQFKTEMDVTLTYYRTLANKILKDVAIQNLKVLQDHLKDSRLFKSSGMATNYDVLRVEVQVSNAETDLLNAEDNIVISEQNLLEVLGKDKETIEVNGELPILDESLLKTLGEADVNNRLDIQALKSRVSSLSYNEKAQNSFWVPRLSAFGQYQYYNNLDTSLTDTDKYRSAYQVGLQLSWNIFDAGTSFSRSKQATEQFVQAEKSYRITELKAKKEFEIWKRKFNYFTNLYKARNNDIAKSKESVRLAREGRRVGARTNTDLLDAEADLYKSQAGAVNAQLGAIEALINLQTSIGQKIYNF